MSQSITSNVPSLIQDPFAGTEYRAIGLLGSGGMADVYLVQHRARKKAHAAKLLRSIYARDRQIVDRLRLEAHTLGKLNHPNIVQIDEFATTPSGLPFIVMERLNGRTLKDELLVNGAIPFQLALLYMMDLLSGLEAVHALGIVHRDIKPSNLFVHGNDSGQSHLKMLDFGMARVLPGISEDAPAPLVPPTRTGAVVGTPLFVSPEAALGQPVDVRTDIYNAAIMLYVMLAGHGPFDDLPNNEAVLRAHAYAPPPPPARRMKHWLGPKIDRVVLHGLAKAPKDRYQTAAEFSGAIYDLMLACLRAINEAEAKGRKSVTPKVSAPPTGEPCSSARIQPLRPSKTVDGGSKRDPRSTRVFVFILVVILSAIAVRLGTHWSLG